MANSYKLEWIGIIAVIIGAIGLIFQIIDIVKLQAADQISWGFLISAIIITILWGIHGFVNNIKAPIVSFFVDLSLVITIIVLKIYYASLK